MNTKFFKLTNLFYQRYPVSRYNQILFPKSGRGYYGVIVVELYSLKFAIPLHSNIRNGLKIRRNPEGKWSGLDYEKAVIIENEQFIGSEYIVQPANDFIFIENKSAQIKKAFTKYVDNYIKAVINGDSHVIRQRYSHTTLCYFHEYLFKNKLIHLNPLATQVTFLK